MTYLDLCQQAKAITEARLEAESPSIAPTLPRRLAVFKQELLALLNEHGVEPPSAEELDNDLSTLAQEAYNSQGSDSYESWKEADQEDANEAA